MKNMEYEYEYEEDLNRQKTIHDLSHAHRLELYPDFEVHRYHYIKALCNPENSGCEDYLEIEKQRLTQKFLTNKEVIIDKHNDERKGIFMRYYIAE